MLAPAPEAFTPHCGKRAPLCYHDRDPRGERLERHAPVTVGFDASDDARRAVAWAGGVARSRGDTSLHLVHALSLPSIPPHEWQLRVEELLARHEESVRARLESARDDLAARGVRCEVFVRRWLPAETLLEHVAEHESALLVVGGRGESAALHLLGSVAARVVRQAPVPVVVVRGRDVVAPPRLVLLGLDGSEAALRTARAVAEWFPQARVRALWSSDPGADEPALGDVAARLEAAGIPGARAEVRLGASPAAPALLELAEDPEVDLVAVGRHGRSGWKERVLGGVTEKLLQLSPCPVLVAH